ncbi:MAG: serine/threonine protein kinase [Candidatus Riflebacteria bacterium]|nr:serine/threonine protein kinase [Candidatus Riflebacteria bacterium]
MTSGTPDSSLSAPAPGTVLEGWTLGRLLGKGGMGCIFEARASTGQLGALKILAAAFAANQQAVRRFRREVQALQRLRHPRVVAILDEHLDHEPPFYGMELLRGGTLADRLGSGGAAGRPGLPLVDLPLLFLDLAEALEVSHAEGVLHRDLKPQNVLFTTEGRAKLADFGLSRAADVTAMTATGVVLGTWAYMAPETLRGRPADERTDLYQLGATLFEAVTGSPPYGTEQLQAVLNGRALPPLPSLELLAPDVQRELPWLEELLRHLTDPVPARRPASAARVKARIETALYKSKEPPRSPAPSRTGPLRPPATTALARRTGADPAETKFDGLETRSASSEQRLRGLLLARRPVLAVSAGVLVLLVGLLAWSLVGPRPEPPSDPTAARPEEQAGPPHPAVDPPPGPGALADSVLPKRITVGADRASLWFAGKRPPDARCYVGNSRGRELVPRTFSFRAVFLTIGWVGLDQLEPDNTYYVQLSGPGASSGFELRTLPVAEDCGLPVLDSGLESPESLAVAASEGNVAVLWTACERGSTSQSIRLRQSYDSGKTWAPTVVLEEAQHCFPSPGLAFLGGSLWASWNGYTGTPGQVSVTRVAGGAANEPEREDSLVDLGGDLVAMGAGEAGSLHLYGLTRPRDSSPKRLARIRVPVRGGKPSAPVVLGPLAGPSVPAEAYAIADPRVADWGGRSALFVNACNHTQLGRLCWMGSGAAGGSGDGPWSPLVAVDPAVDVKHFSVAGRGERCVVAFESGGAVMTRVLGADGKWLGRALPVVDGGMVPALAAGPDRFVLACVAASSRGGRRLALHLRESLDGTAWTGRDLCSWDGQPPRRLEVALTAETVIVAAVTANGQLVAGAYQRRPDRTSR